MNEAGKALDQNSICAEVTKLMVETVSNLLLKVSNQLHKRQEFPGIWREVLVVLISKDKQVETLTAPTFRPICL